MQDKWLQCMHKYVPSSTIFYAVAGFPKRPIFLVQVFSYELELARGDGQLNGKTFVIKGNFVATS